jgi:Lectin C-type domain
VSIESLEENSAILDVIGKCFSQFPFNIFETVLLFVVAALLPDESFWTAGSRMGQVDGSFYWDSTGYPIGPFTYWAIDQPDNALGTEECIQFYGYGENHLWHDNDCWNEARFICESHSC